MTRVLVVDDEPQIRRALRTSLEAHGYQVATAGTGEEGVLAAAETAPDLVLLDLGLPLDVDLAAAEVEELGEHRRQPRDRKSTRLNSSHEVPSRMPSSA